PISMSVAPSMAPASRERFSAVSICSWVSLPVDTSNSPSLNLRLTSTGMCTPRAIAVAIGRTGLSDGESGFQAGGPQHIAHDGGQVDQAHVNAERFQPRLNGQEPVEPGRIDDLNTRHDEVDRFRLADNHLIHAPFQGRNGALDDLLCGHNRDRLHASI